MFLIGDYENARKSLREAYNYYGSDDPEVVELLQDAITISKYNMGFRKGVDIEEAKKPPQAEEPAIEEVEEEVIEEPETEKATESVEEPVIEKQEETTTEKTEK